MIETVAQWILQKAAEVESRFQIDPWIFLALMVFCSLPFYYTLFRLVRAAAAGNRRQISLWSTLFLLVTIFPYLYVMIWGRNLPWYVYGAAALLAGQALFGLVRRLRRARKGGQKHDKIVPIKGPENRIPPEPEDVEPGKEREQRRLSR